MAAAHSPPPPALILLQPVQAPSSITTNPSTWKSPWPSSPCLQWGGGTRDGHKSPPGTFTPCSPFAIAPQDAQGGCQGGGIPKPPVQQDGGTWAHGDGKSLGVSALQLGASSRIKDLRSHVPGSQHGGSRVTGGASPYLIPLSPGQGGGGALEAEPPLGYYSPLLFIMADGALVAAVSHSGS